MKVAVDPGHGGRDPGAVSPINLALGDKIATREVDLTIDISLKLNELLKEAGEVTLLTRTADDYIELYKRANIANEENVDIFVSVHVNASPVAEAKGIEAFSFPGSKKGAELRDLILAEIKKLFPDWVYRGAKTANFAVLRETFMPACLVECGFLTNPEEERRLNEEETRQKFAQAIFNGIMQYKKQEGLF